MLNGALAAFGIIVISLIIPIVHFVAAPLSPFIGGFVGGGLAKADEARVITFGLLVAGLMLVPAVILIVLALFMDGDLFGLPEWLIWGVAITIVPYTWFGVTLGALISYALRQKESKANTGEPSRR